MGISLTVQILSASDVGGVYPFVVVCFDGDVNNELYKTEAATGGHTTTWNHTFELDLTTNIKALVAAGRPEPTYLTFFLFDTGTPGVPSLGSAGVLLATVRDKGRAQGDFPVVNGTGTLRLVVTSEKTNRGRFGFLSSNAGSGDPAEDDEKFGNAAKIAGITAGVAALGAGIGYAVHHNKKKKQQGQQGGAAGEAEAPAEGGKKKKKWFGSRNADEAAQVEEPEDQPQEQGGNEGQAREVAERGGGKAWWEGESDGAAGAAGERGNGAGEARGDGGREPSRGDYDDDDEGEAEEADDVAGGVRFDHGDDSGHSGHGDDAPEHIDFGMGHFDEPTLEGVGGEGWDYGDHEEGYEVGIDDDEDGIGEDY
eukprot:GFKZ01010777.1.p1 GENE.GFKZ01010777.1~~GFKZ01010777.1.p1  ORF type:complete len:367 (+),score=84.66 GFKZ01010777.1:45-1145(+)